MNVLARVEWRNFVVSEKILRFDALKRIKTGQFALEDVELGCRSWLRLLHIEDRTWTHLGVLDVLSERVRACVTRR